MSDDSKVHRVQAAPDPSVVLADPNLQRIYANGFSIGMTNADTFILLQAFNRPVAIVNMSYTLAKTLSEKLQGLVSDWEAKTGHPLQTTDSIDRALKLKKQTPDTEEK